MTVAGDETGHSAETAFLDLLARDMEPHFERIEPVSPQLAAQIAELTIGMTADPDTPIRGSVDI